MKRLGIMVLAFLLLSGFLTSNALANNSKAFQGRKLFVTYCYLCHGMNGKGDGPLAGKLKVPPADLTDSNRVGKRTDADLFGIIQGGKHALVTDEMPKWGKVMPEPQIKSLVAYVRFLSHSKNPPLGDCSEGEEVYAQYCSSCHGKDGKGNGVLSKLIPIKPADHTNTEKMDKMTNDELIAIITDGKGKDSFMPGWKDILSKSDIENVVGYMRLMCH